MEETLTADQRKELCDATIDVLEKDVERVTHWRDQAATDRHNAMTLSRPIDCLWHDRRVAELTGHLAGLEAALNQVRLLVDMLGGEER